MEKLIFFTGFAIFLTLFEPAGTKDICINSRIMDIKIGFANVNGILGKLIDLQSEIIASDYDVLGIAESKIDQTVTDDVISFPGYRVFRNDRKKGGGGVALYAKSFLPVFPIKSPTDFGIKQEHLETVGVRIGSGDKSFIFVTVYIPKSCPSVVEDFGDYLLRAFRSQLHRLVIVGDFNADQLSSSLAQQSVIDLLSSIHAIQTVSAPTRPASNTLLDLAIIGDQSRHISTTVLPPIGSSDHNLISVVIANYPKRLPVPQRFS